MRTSKAIFCLAVLFLGCFAMASARSLLNDGEADLVALASTALLESGSALSAEEQALLSSSLGQYGTKAVGEYGGLFEGQTAAGTLEAGDSKSAPAPAAAKSAAFVAQSGAMMAAGAFVALTAMLL